MVVCENCGYQTKKIQWHHLVPRSEGGDDSSDNLVALCVSSHRQHHSEQGDFVRWGRQGGQKTAQNLHFLFHLKQFITCKARKDWVLANRPTQLDQLNYLEHHYQQIA